APAAAAAPAAAVATAPAAAPVAASASSGSAGKADVEAAVRAWAAAWSSKDVGGYLGAYGREFNPPGRQSRSAWEQERRNRIVGKKQISVQVSDLNVAVTGNKAVAHFRQAYSADSLHVTSRKTLEFVRSGDRWTIVRETNGA
ncbi:DUF4440 domain-containing protein, partial [Ramlibacter sp.]|uniref:L,D-transpeptidase Cds6 family protein n=1 Tax=Ramlibacter sp. TaxID=1917967 RepID=UPI00261C636C